MTITITKIKSNSPLIQPFVVHPDATTLPKEKILGMQQSSEILKESACAILEVNVNNLDKMQEDFVIPEGSVVNYGGPQFHPWTISEDWTNPAYTDHIADNISQFSDYPSQAITIIIPIEPQEGSDFCFKGDEESQDFRHKWFRDGFHVSLTVDCEDQIIDDGVFTAPFQSLNLLPFVSQVQEKEAEEGIFTDLDKAIEDAKVKEMEANDEYEKAAQLTENLKDLKYILENLSAQGIEVEVKIKK